MVMITMLTRRRGDKEVCTVIPKRREVGRSNQKMIKDHFGILSQRQRAVPELRQQVKVKFFKISTLNLQFNTTQIQVH